MPIWLVSIFEFILNYIDKMFNWMSIILTEFGVDVGKFLFIIVLILLGLKILDWRMKGFGRIFGYAFIILGVLFGLYMFGIL